jgi:hypothetical protein
MSSINLNGTDSKYKKTPDVGSPKSCDIQTMTITVPEGKRTGHDPGPSRARKAKIVPLVEHGENVVKSSQGKIAKVDYRESELF